MSTFVSSMHFSMYGFSPEHFLLLQILRKKTIMGSGNTQKDKAYADGRQQGWKEGAVQGLELILSARRAEWLKEQKVMGVTFPAVSLDLHDLRFLQEDFNENARLDKDKRWTDQQLTDKFKQFFDSIVMPDEIWDWVQSKRRTMILTGELKFREMSAEEVVWLQAQAEAKKAEVEEILRLLGPSES